MTSNKVHIFLYKRPLFKTRFVSPHTDKLSCGICLRKYKYARSPTAVLSQL